MTYGPYLIAIGLDTGEMEPAEVERLGILAANEVANTARELMLAGWKEGESQAVTAEHYLRALLSLDDGEKERLRAALLNAPSWWTPACGSVVRAGLDKP